MSVIKRIGCMLILLAMLGCGSSDEESSMLGTVDFPSPTKPPGFITIGSSAYEVNAVQGFPTQIINISTTKVWYFGSDYLFFSPVTNRVTSWSNYGGKLKVIMVAGNNTTSATKIAQGSSVDDVIKIQGTPTQILERPSTNVWYYGNDYINISVTTNSVTSWSNIGGVLII